MSREESDEGANFEPSHEKENHSCKNGTQRIRENGCRKHRMRVIFANSGEYSESHLMEERNDFDLVLVSQGSIEEMQDAVSYHLRSNTPFEDTTAEGVYEL